MQTYEYPTIILPDGDKRFRSLEINKDGSLVFEQTDTGKSTAQLAPNGGDSDYEYWITIQAADVHEVIFGLIKERFDEQGKLKEWLKQNNIKYSFDSY